MFFRVLATALALSALTVPAMAHHDENHGATEEAAAIGPVIGAPAPAFTALNAEGAPVTLESLAGTNGTIVSFVRSADWCPFCKRQLIELNEQESAFAAAGWQLVGISYDSPEKLARFAGKSNISYPLLSDTDSATIKAFGLLNEEYEAGSKAYGIPHPALVFIGNDGTVRKVLREEGYRDRPSQEVIEEAIVALSAKPSGS